MAGGGGCGTATLLIEPEDVNEGFDDIFGVGPFQLEGAVQGLSWSDVEVLTQLDEPSDHGGILRDDQSRGILEGRDFSVGMHLDDTREHLGGSV